MGRGPWEAVYGSEAYVVDFADEIGAAPVMVDLERVVHRVSGTAVRADVAGHWSALHPVVRAGLTRRVVVLGAESTGTTTLAMSLAELLGVPWVAEYGRELSARKAAEAGSIWDVAWRSADFMHVADQQERLEEATIRSWVADARGSTPGRFGPLVVCDTDVLATAVWHRRYCERPAPGLLDRARRRPPLLYVLTTPREVPFVQDGLRDGEHVRKEMTEWFREVLDCQPVPWIEVSGTPDERVAAVIEMLDRTAPPPCR